MCVHPKHRLVEEPCTHKHKHTRNIQRLIEKAHQKALSCLYVCTHTHACVCVIYIRVCTRIYTYITKQRLIEKAHQKALSCLALNADGSLLASASQKGTIIRLWATSQTDNPVCMYVCVYMCVCVCVCMYVCM